MTTYDTPELYRADSIPGYLVEMFAPRTPVERELLAECASRARVAGEGVATILAAAETYWHTHGRSQNPRGWRARATAARRMIDRWSRAYAAGQ